MEESQATTKAMHSVTANARCPGGPGAHLGRSFPHTCPSLSHMFSTSIHKWHFITQIYTFLTLNDLHMLKADYGRKEES